jgi:hypothetical protein
LFGPKLESKSTFGPKLKLDFLKSFGTQTSDCVYQIYSATLNAKSNSFVFVTKVIVFFYEWFWG